MDLVAGMDQMRSEGLFRLRGCVWFVGVFAMPGEDEGEVEVDLVVAAPSEFVRFAAVELLGRGE